MIKVLRKEVLLTVKEYEEINKTVFDKNKHMNINKDIAVIDGNNTFYFNINIEVKNRVVYASIFNKPNPLLKDNVTRWTSIGKITGLMGVHVCRYIVSLPNGEELSYDIYFNINKECFNNKKSFYKQKQNLITWGIKNNKERASNEVIYADFKDEKELALATYCMLINPNSLRYKDDVLELYENKLAYIGIDLDDYSGRWIDYSSNQHKYPISNMSKKDILNLMLSYIAFLKGNYIPIHDKYDENKKNRDVATNSYCLYECYIALLED